MPRPPCGSREARPASATDWIGAGPLSGSAHTLGGRVCNTRARASKTTTWPVEEAAASIIWSAFHARRRSAGSRSVPDSHVPTGCVKLSRCQAEGDTSADRRKDGVCIAAPESTGRGRHCARRPTARFRFRHRRLTRAAKQGAQQAAFAVMARGWRHAVWPRETWRPLHSSSSARRSATPAAAAVGLGRAVRPPACQREPVMWLWALH